MDDTTLRKLDDIWRSVAPDDARVKRVRRNLETTYRLLEHNRQEMLFIGTREGAAYIENALDQLDEAFKQSLKGSH